MYQQQLQQESIELGNKRNQTRLLESINELTLQQKQQLLINILQISKQERKAEILQLMRIIMSQVDFFHQFQVENIDHDAYDYCLKHLTFETFQKNTVIFEKGEQPHYMYVVIRGQVSLYSNDHLVDQKITKKHSLSVDYGRDTPCSNRIKFSDFKVKSLVRLTEFKDWKTFGEQAILDQRLRTNFAVCDIDSTLAILSKENYINAVQILEKKKEQHRMNNFKLNPSFQGLNKKLINIMLFTYQSSDYKYRDIIYKQGQADSDIIYIIKQGEFLVYQDQKINEQQQKRVRKQIAIMTTGEIFGDYEAFEKITRQFNVQCNSHTGSLIIIPLQSLYQKLSQFNEQHYVQQLKQLCMKKNKWYQDFKTNIEHIQEKYQHFLTIQEQKSNNLNGSSKQIDSPSKTINENKQLIDPQISVSPITEFKNTLNYLTSIDDQQQADQNNSINIQKTKNKNTIYIASPDKLQPLPKIQLVSNRQQERNKLSTPDRFKQVIQHKMTILKRMHNLSPEDSININTLEQKTIYVQLPKQVKLEQNIEKQWPIKATIYLNDLDDRIRYHSNNSKIQNCNSSRDSSVIYDQYSLKMDEGEYNSQRTSRMGILSNILQHSVTKRGKNKKKRALTLKYREYLESQFQQKTQNSLLYS